MARSVFVLVAAVMAVTFSGCSSPRSAGPSGGSAPGPIRWKSCPGHAGWQCGTLAVPLDYAHPGPSISIAVNRHPATDRGRRVGALVVNPGGPGVSGVDFAYGALDGLLDPVLVQDFDIVGFDPRGVGASAPIECSDGPTLDRLNHLNPDPRTPAEQAALLAGAKELAGDCERRSGALLPFVATVDVARDMETLREALGETKLTYLGFSYGTLLGATYASLFPTRVRALALDGALDPAVDEGTMSLEQAVAFEQSLDSFLQECATSSACPFVADGAPTLRAAFDALVARIAAAPLAAGGDAGRGGGTAGAGVGPGEAFIAILGELYEPTDWPALAAELAAAQHGDGSLMLADYDAYVGRLPDGTYSNEEVANVAIDCVDQPNPTLPQLEALAASARRQAPYFGGPVVWAAADCLDWPVPPVTRTGPLHAPGAPPILVVGSTGDPVTPLPWARALATELGSGVLVTRHGDGHTGYPNSACVRRVVDAYLTTLALPTPAEADCAS
jgi:pimeloyl-ACP methyl ester carboxylesterase